MSMNFEKPITADQQDFIKKMFGDDVAAIDEKTVLLNRKDFLQSQMRDIANVTKQVVALELNDVGAQKILSDGSRHEVTPDGWKQIE